MRSMGPYLTYFTNLSDQHRKWFEQHRMYIGDVHNHCNISYGHGSLEDACSFAAQQLDFFSVTGHFSWPDMRGSEAVPQEVIEYHEAGFTKLKEHWEEYLAVLQQAGVPSFPSYEYHSFTYGDYTILERDAAVPLPQHSGTGDPLQEVLRTSDARRDHRICFPHHIGYKQGYRGINWDTFGSAASPLVEIISMHGCAESLDTPLPYLHTMGPLSSSQTMSEGLRRGHRFGLLGNTDHHNASPGSYGYGRSGVWARSGSRAEIWEGLIGKQTAALSGDPILGALFSDHGRVDAYAAACDEIESMTLLKNGQVIRQHMPVYDPLIGLPHSVRVSAVFGWGEKHTECQWDVRCVVLHGTISDAHARLRGVDVVDPLDTPSASTEDRPLWKRSADQVRMRAMTTGNPTASTPGMQGFSLEVELDSTTAIEVAVLARYHGKVIERTYRYLLQELIETNAVEYLDGFVSPALCIGPAVPVAHTIAEMHLNGEPDAIYTLRVKQKHDSGYLWANAMSIEDGEA